MYKRSEPIRSLHSVQNHMANVYSSEVCLQTKNFPKISKFFFFPKTLQNMINYQKISNISIKTMLELRTKFGNFGNFGNFGHILDWLRTIHNTCSNLIGSEPLSGVSGIHFLIRLCLRIKQELCIPRAWLVLLICTISCIHHNFCLMRFIPLSVMPAIPVMKIRNKWVQL